MSIFDEYLAGLSSRTIFSSIMHIWGVEKEGDCFILMGSVDQLVIRLNSFHKSIPKMIEDTVECNT